MPVTQLPGFADGEVSVQDAAAQRAAPLLLAPAAARPARACSTPAPRPAARPRTCSSSPTSTCWRSTATPARLARVDDDARPPRPARRDPSPPTPATPARLVGRPRRSTRSCSTRRAAPRASSAAIPTCAGCAAPSDIAALAATQARLLDALWPLLAPGGRLLYCTCSVFRAEGQAQIDAFLQRQRRCRPWPPTRLRPGTCCRCPTIDETPPAPGFARRGGRLLLRPDRESSVRRRRPPADDPVAAARLPAPPQRASRARRRGVARCAAGRLGRRRCAGPAAARAADAELTVLRGRPRRGRRLPQLRGRLRARRRRRGRADQGGAAVLRRRGRDLPRPLVLARPARRRRGAGLAHRLPAADLDLPRDDRRRPEPELPDREPRRSPRSAAASRWKVAEAGQLEDGAATTSSSATGSTPRCCRGRCRSASAASPTGSCRSSARCASIEERPRTRGAAARARRR